MVFSAYPTRPMVATLNVPMTCRDSAMTAHPLPGLVLLHGDPADGKNECIERRYFLDGPWRPETPPGAGSSSTACCSRCGGGWSCTSRSRLRSGARVPVPPKNGSGTSAPGSVPSGPTNTPSGVSRKVWPTPMSRIQKSWPLTDDDADQVIEASFDPQPYGDAVAAAFSVTAAARAVGHLIETTRQQRQLPHEAAPARHMMWIRVQRSLPRAWDASTGELLPPDGPSVMETMPFRDRLDAVLLQVVEPLRPLAATLVAELHAVCAVPHLGSWYEWVEKAAGMVPVHPAGGRDVRPRTMTTRNS